MIRGTGLTPNLDPQWERILSTPLCYADLTELAHYI